MFLMFCDLIAKVVLKTFLFAIFIIIILFEWFVTPL